MRPRVHHGVELQLQPGADSSGDADGETDVDYRGDGREVLVGKDGKATGVSYIDKATRTEKRISARAVVVAASACESARLLLNSKSAQFPDGVANSSGTAEISCCSHN